MILHHQRHFTPTGFSQAILTIGDTLFCLLLEDEVRKLVNMIDKVKGKTAIPPGDYKLVVEYSNKFKKLMAELKDVPFFSEAKYHSGADVLDTDGCPLMGLTRPKPDKIYGGIQNKLTEKLVALLQNAGGDHIVRVRNP